MAAVVSHPDGQPIVLKAGLALRGGLVGYVGAKQRRYALRRYSSAAAGWCTNPH